jgi:hypothetical protein
MRCKYMYFQKCAWRNMGKTYDHMILKKPIRHSRPISSHSSDPEDFWEWISHDQSIYIIINKQPQQFDYEISEIICSRLWISYTLKNASQIFHMSQAFPGIPTTPNLGGVSPNRPWAPAATSVQMTWGFNQLVQTRHLHPQSTIVINK